MMIAKARGWSCAVVFFDAVTAFASMLRALVCHQSSSDCPSYEALLATVCGATPFATGDDVIPEIESSA